MKDRAENKPAFFILFLFFFYFNEEEDEPTKPKRGRQNTPGTLQISKLEHCKVRFTSTLKTFNK